MTEACLRDALRGVTAETVEKRESNIVVRS
jgi:hypothetical protein